MIKIDWQQMPPRMGEANGNDTDKAGEGRLFPRVKDNGMVSFEELCQKAAKRFGCSDGTMEGTFTDLMDEVVQQLAEGKAVELKGLGTLSLTLTVGGDVTATTRRRMNKVQVKGVAFRASDELTSAVRNLDPKFVWDADDVAQYAPKASDLVQPLQSYLDEHGSITRTAFMDLFHLKRTTAIDRLNELSRMGVIRREGFNRDSVYVLK